MIYILYRWTGEGSSKDDMIIMENLVPQGFVPLKQGDPKVHFRFKKKNYFFHVFLTFLILHFHVFSPC